MAMLGDLHNQAIDSLRVSLSSIDDLEVASFDFVERRFEKDYKITPRNIQDGDFALLSDIKQKSIFKVKNPQTRSSLLPPRESFEENMSSQEIAYIDEIFNVISQNLDNLKDIEDAFNSIDLNINNSSKLTIVEKQGLWAVSAIAKSSYLYNLSAIQTRAASAEEVVITDAESALIALLDWKKVAKSVASGLVFGPTGIVVAMAKEVVKGAIIGSSVHFLGSLI